MSQCACGGKLRLVHDIDVPNVYRVMCSNPWHEFDPESFGDFLPSEEILANQGLHLTPVDDEFQEAAQQMQENILDVLFRALGRPSDDGKGTNE
jgi:hypothetical protein